MDRKEFLNKGCTACLTAFAIGAGLSSCSVATQYLAGDLGKDGLTIRKKDFKIAQKGSTDYRSFVIIRNEALLFPVCIYRHSENDYTAIWMQCAHQGAELQASGDVLHCPAHGSEYNNKGVVTNGPAEENLRTFPVVISKDELFIDLRKKA